MGQGRHTLRSVSDPVYPRPIMRTYFVYRDFRHLQHKKHFSGGECPTPCPCLRVAVTTSQVQDKTNNTDLLTRSFGVTLRHFGSISGYTSRLEPYTFRNIHIWCILLSMPTVHYKIHCQCIHYAIWLLPSTTVNYCKWCHNMCDL